MSAPAEWRRRGGFSALQDHTILGLLGGILRGGCFNALLTDAATREDTLLKVGRRQGCQGLSISSLRRLDVKL